LELIQNRLSWIDRRLEVRDDRLDLGIGEVPHLTLGAKPDMPRLRSTRTVFLIRSVVAMHRKASRRNLQRNVLNIGFAHVEDDLHAALGRLGPVPHVANDTADLERQPYSHGVRQPLLDDWRSSTYG